MPRGVCCGSTSRYLGLLAATLSRWKDAGLHFQAAIEMDRRTGGRPWPAHTQADYGRMLLARGGPHDREQAHDLIHSARATYHKLGMHTHAERAVSAHRKRHPTRSRALIQVGAMTERATAGAHSPRSPSSGR